MPLACFRANPRFSWLDDLLGGWRQLLEPGAGTLQ
jgi:hypothetical protein